MQRRSERLANLQQVKPISYRETRVKRVFKKIRRKCQSAAAQTKAGHTTWKEKKTEKGWGMESSRLDDSEQPCCSKYLEDQSHLLRQYMLEDPTLTEPMMDVTTQKDSQYLLENSPLMEPTMDPQLLVIEEDQRPFKMKMFFLALIFILVIFFRFMSGFSSHRATSKEAMTINLSQQREFLQENLQKDIDVFRQHVYGLQNFVNDLGSVQEHWELQKNLFLQSQDSKTGNKYTRKEDFALKSEGASVVKFSKSFKTGAKVCMLWFCWDYERSPDVILERDNSPGNCWAMDGSEGYIVIKLSKPVKPSSVALYHISKKISQTNEIRSAPQHLSVYGFKNDFEKEEGKFLGSFVYKIDGYPLQCFKFKGANLDTFQYLLLKISSNWNHPNYTCIYSFHVYS